jgi:hypothetical protein
MPTKVFISHVDWNVKTPFVSYSDEKFVKELENINFSPVVVYFEKRAKIRHRIGNGIYNYFVNIRRKQVEKQRLLEKREKNTLLSSLIKCLGL